MRCAVLFALVWPLAAVKTGSKDALGLGLDSQTEARPVMKVVNMLQDMNKQLTADMEDDKEVHEKMDCFCDTNEKEKTEAIEQGGIKIESLKSFLGEAAAKIAEMKVKRKETKTELASDQKGLADATALRMQDNKAFAKDEADTIVAIKATKDAITVLQKHNTGLVEVRAVASQLQKANVLKMGILDNIKAAALKDFMKDAQGATSFLAIPGFKSYGSQSGQIFGILSQMLEDFEDHLSSARVEERRAVSDYKALKGAKEDQIADGKKDVIDLDKRLGSTGEKQAQAVKELKDTKEQKGSDVTFLANLRTKCSEHDKEYDTRIKDRQAELTAVENAIETLNSEEVFKLFDKSLGFLQMSSTAAEGESLKMKRQSAASTLERAAAQTDSPMLALLAGRVRLDAFTEVKKAISGMVAELEKQQQDEVEKKDWCVKEFHENDKADKAADTKKGNLETKRDDLKKSVDTLASDMKTTKAEVAELKNQMKRASQNREGANADYQQTITDQRMTQMVLNKAMNTMKEVYALLQNGKSHRVHHHRSQGPAEPEFKQAGQNAGGAQVIALLEGIIADSKKAEADAIQAEEQAQSAYEQFMLDSNTAITKKSEQIMSASGNKASAEEDLNMAKKDLAATNKKLATLAAENDDLHDSCDFITKNFKTRQDARSAETDALKEAMSILSGSR